MPGCAVFGCTNYTRTTKGTRVKYYHFPKDEILREKWIDACKRADPINMKHACICSIHFEASCFEVSLREQMRAYARKYYRDLKEDAVPTLHLPHGATVKMEESETGPSVLFIKSEPSSSNACKPQARKRKIPLILEEVSVKDVSQVDMCLLIKEEPTQIQDEYLQKRMEVLEAENAILKEELLQKNKLLERINSNLQKFFSPAQIKRIFSE